jgi:hypothetical protein
MAFALAGLGAGTFAVATAGAAAGTTAPAVPALTQITAAHHPGYDRVVFQFRGGVPAQHSARYVSQVIADPSGLPVTVSGSARLLVRFSPATGHNAQGLVTYGAAQRTYALPEIIQVVKAGDFESVLTFGVCGRSHGPWPGPVTPSMTPEPKTHAVSPMMTGPRTRSTGAGGPLRRYGALPV